MELFDLFGNCPISQQIPHIWGMRIPKVRSNLRDSKYKFKKKLYVYSEKKKKKKNHVSLCQIAKSWECYLGRDMILGSPPLPTCEILSEPLSCTKTSLRGRHAVDHERSRVSLWVGAHGWLVVRSCSMVETSMRHSPCGLIYHERACRPWPLKGHMVSLGHTSLNTSELRVVYRDLVTIKYGWMSPYNRGDS